MGRNRGDGVKSIYSPKRIYKERYSFVLDHKALFNQLEASCKDICKIEKNALSLQIHSVHHEWNEADLMQYAIPRIENFLDRVVTEKRKLNREELALLEPNPEWFLKLQKDMSDRASITVHETNLLVQGLPEDAEHCFSEFSVNVRKAFNIRTKECPRDMCRFRFGNTSNAANMDRNMRDGVKSIYSPKRIYEERYCFVLGHKTIFNLLKASCKDICKIETNGLTLQIHSVHHEWNEADLMQYAIPRIESFLDRVVTEKRKLNREELTLLEPNPEWFLKLQKDMSERAFITVHKTNLLVQGLPEDVEHCFSEFSVNVRKAFNIRTKECPRDMCRVLVCCGVIERLNDMFDGKVEVSCNTQDERVDFIGEISHVEEVEREMQKMKLNQKSPKLTGLKLELLKTILPKDEVEEVIYARFRESGVRGDVKENT